MSPSRAQSSPPPPPIADISPFGVGANPADSAQMTSIGLYVSRVVGSTSWDLCGTPDGKWNWDGLDSDMKMMTDYHINFGGWFYAAGFTGGKRGDGLPIDSNHQLLPGFPDYVTAVVNHCKDKIKYWEVFNEPPNGLTPFQTFADYALMVSTAYDATKAADPSGQIGLATKSVDVSYLDRTIQAGAKDHFDYVTVHPYEVLGLAVDHPGTESVFMHIVPTIRKMLAARDPAKAHVPIVFTELGYMSKSNGDPTPGQALVKAYTMGIAQGVTCIDWFQGKDSGGNGAMGLIDADGKPRPAFTAMAQMIKNLGQHPVALGWTFLNKKDNAFVFKGEKGNVMVTWSPDTDHVNFGVPVQVIDPVTGNASMVATCDLTTSPVLILDPPDELVKQAVDNKPKPFPWNGDYTDAKSVSVTMGQTNVEQGLHTQSATSIAADVVTYGGFGRNGGVPGGTVFMVDPNFLSFDSSPIEICVKTRRDSQNDPAQLNLEYESTSGFKKCPVFSIPDNTSWHEAKWIINDAEFVSTWGFNFRFDPGSYSIQSVTVTKLNQ